MPDDSDLTTCGGCGATVYDVEIFTCDADGCGNEYCQHCGRERRDGLAFCRACQKKQDALFPPDPLKQMVTIWDMIAKQIGIPPVA
jgi:hypothetical protein